MSLDDRIPNNVDLSSDRRLQKALEKWLPRYQDWWQEMGPEGFQTADVYLRTAVSVEAGGWAHFDHVKMPDYRWGIFLTPVERDRKVGFGDIGKVDSFDEVPGEFRNSLRRLIVTQGDTEPASVEQQRLLGQCCPSLYDLRNLFQVNVEEGRHLWAMVYLLHRYFGRDGRDEADEMLERRSGHPDKPRILEAFNQPIKDWLSFYCFTMFVDRDGKFQLGALAESGFAPLRRTTQFMLTEEAHHLFVGEMGIDRVVQRSAELTREGDGDPRPQGGIPLEIIQRYINFWYSHALDLFGGEISSNAADFFASGLKGRWQESKKYEEHTGNDQFYEIPLLEGSRLSVRQVPLRNAMNEILRDEYIRDSERAIKRWNKTIAAAGVEFELTLPSRRWHRHIGEYAGQSFGYDGRPGDDPAAYAQDLVDRLPSEDDLSYVASLMVPVVEPDKMANWIAPPTKGINGNPWQFEYVRMNLARAGPGLALGGSALTLPWEAAITVASLPSQSQRLHPLRRATDDAPRHRPHDEDSTMSLRLAALISALVIPALLLSCGDGGQNSGGSGGNATTSRPASGTGDPSKDTALMDPAVASIQAFIDEKVDTSKASWKTNLKAPPKATFTEGKSYFWEIQTNKGPIKIKLMPDVAPEHVTNTIFLVRSGFYDGLKFHRVIPGFMAQGGCPNGDGRGSPGFRYNGEFSSSVKHDRPGLLSMANAGPGTDGSQFFITFVPTGGLDGKHTIFGEVVEGMDTVKALEAAGSSGAGTPRETLLMEKSTIVVE